MQIKDNPLLEKIKKGEEVLWINPGKIPFQEASENLPLTEEGTSKRPGKDWNGLHLCS